jgi:hypothetical protein
MPNPPSTFWQAIILRIMALAMVSFLNGCRRPDTDVSSSPRYNFSSFTNTAWKTKVKVALADMELYTGRHALTILGPRAFDKTHPHYYPPDHTRMITELPVGTRLRIARLMKDSGNWGGVRVRAVLDDAREVNVDEDLLASNRFFFSSPSSNWGVNPDMLEKP